MTDDKGADLVPLDYQRSHGAREISIGRNVAGSAAYALAAWTSECILGYLLTVQFHVFTAASTVHEQARMREQFNRDMMIETFYILVSAAIVFATCVFLRRRRVIKLRWLQCTLLGAAFPIPRWSLFLWCYAHQLNYPEGVDVSAVLLLSVAAGWLAA